MRNKLGRLETSILDRLVENGYNAMVVGGAVRDSLIGKPFTDIDIATNAPYDRLVEIMEGLGQLKFAGKTFGVLLVGGVEVATYRVEVCKDNKVIEVDRAPSALDDSWRRDFTMNAIYYNYAIDIIHDFHGGAYDIQNGLLRAVGDPYERFNEDYSRILRAVYQSATLGFTIEAKTKEAMIELGANIKKVPKALVGKIVRKAIKDGCFHDFLKSLKELSLLEYVFPEMLHTVGLKQNPKYHQFDVWEHTLGVVLHAELFNKGNIAFVMGALLHDVAKGTEGIRGVNKEGQPNDLGHEETGVAIARGVCKRLELGKAITDEVSIYVRWHGERMNTTEKSVKHFLFKLKGSARDITSLNSLFHKLVNFMECDAMAFEPSFSRQMLTMLDGIELLGESVLSKQIFYSNQFNFKASVIAQHPNVNPIETKKWIEFFIRQNIIEEEAVIKILDKKVL